MKNRDIVKNKNKKNNKKNTLSIETNLDTIQCMCSVVSDSVTPRTVAQQAPLSMGILQARILEWVACPAPGDLPNPGIKPTCPELWADSLLAEPQGKPKSTGVGSLSLLQGIFPTQELNRGLPTLQTDSLPTELSGKMLDCLIQIHLIF